MPRLAQLPAGFSISFTFGARWSIVLLFLLLFLAVMGSLFLLPVRHTPERFQVPLFPVTPALGILFTIHLIGSLGWPAYVRWVGSIGPVQAWDA